LRDGVLMGTRVCAKGEIGYAGSVAQALERHVDEVSEFLNADELGVSLPPRAKDVVAALGRVNVRALLDLVSPRGPRRPKGQVFAVSRTEGERLVR